jgi:hypothetical protein
MAQSKLVGDYVSVVRALGFMVTVSPFAIKVLRRRPA